MGIPEVTGGSFVVTVRGRVGPSVRAAFDDMEVTSVGDATVLRGARGDQAGLYGLLQRVQDVGLEVIEVHREPGDVP